MDYVEGLIVQLRRRGMGGYLREFLLKKEIRARKFAELEDRLRGALEAGKVTPSELDELFVRHARFGHKRVMLLRQVPKKIEALGEPEPKGLSEAPLVGKGVRRPTGSKVMPGYYVGHSRVSGIEVDTFTTLRTISYKEDIDRESLKETARGRFENAQIVASFSEAYRCLDHVVSCNGRSFLLVDCPPGTESGQVPADLKRYQQALEGDDLGSPFVDWWPAVGGVYDDPSEGVINAVKFEANDRAQASGKFGVLQDLDYRKNEYHKGGSEVGQVAVYGLAVAWKLPRGDRAYVVLPGTRAMLDRVEINGVMFPPLSHVDFVLPTTAEAFKHATARLLSKLP